MIKANELRIGNYVNALEDNCGDGVGFVSVSGNQLSFFDNITSIGYLIEPIPLTEEWLLKFGFEENTTSWTNCEASLSHVKLRKPMKYLSYNGVIMLHVHQLQNLYFSLTGEELKTLKFITDEK